MKLTMLLFDITWIKASRLAKPYSFRGMVRWFLVKSYRYSPVFYELIENS